MVRPPLHKHLAQLPEYKTPPTPRLSFLYSSLAGRKASNPTGFSSALSWWRLTLQELVSQGLLGEDKLILVADDNLRESLRWEGVGRPSSLGTILAELANTSHAIPIDAYLATTGIAGNSWLSLLSKPVWWTLSQARTRVFGNSELGESAEESQWKRKQGDWVLQDLVDRAAGALIPKLPSLQPNAISRLYTLASFHAAVGSICFPGVTLSIRDCLVLAKFLSSKGLCVLEGEVIKFTTPNLARGDLPKVTDSDIGILTLLTTLSNLSEYIASIEVRIAEQQSMVLQYLGKKQMTLVKSHVRSRKRLESLLGERISSSDKLGEVLGAIERAQGDEEAVAALTLGTKTLRILLSSPTLSLDHIDETSIAMSEVLADAEDINRAINDTGATLPAEQEDEVEAELDALVKEEEVREKLEKLKLQEQQDAAQRERKAHVDASVDGGEKEEVIREQESLAEAQIEKRRVLAIEQTLSAMSVPTSVSVNGQEPEGKEALLEGI